MLESACVVYAFSAYYLHNWFDAYCESSDRICNHGGHIAGGLPMWSSGSALYNGFRLHAIILSILCHNTTAH